jgi:hypothetical protein
MRNPQSGISLVDASPDRCFFGRTELDPPIRIGLQQEIADSRQDIWVLFFLDQGEDFCAEVHGHGVLPI